VDKTPKHLSIAAKTHMRRVQNEYDLSPDAAMILVVALENWDMANEARQMLRTEGMILGGRRHPAIEIQKQGDAIFLRCMRELGLNLNDPGDVGRPPHSLG